jgi:tetratricopeptide (TPR) repeat protein
MDLLRLLAPDVIAREQQRAHELVQAVGGLPLALTLMGNYLRRQTYGGGGSSQARRITAALERLSDASERLQISEPHSGVESHPSLTDETQLSLQSIISITDQLLSNAARAALYALSVFPPKPNSFSEEAALAVIATHANQINKTSYPDSYYFDLLDALMDSGLLEATAAGRYMLHQTIADYSRLRRPTTEPQEKLMSYVMDFLTTHKRSYESLELENSTILVTLEYAHELNKQAELVRMVSDYMPFFLRSGFYAIADGQSQRAYAAAVDLGNQYDVASILLYSGQVKQHQGKLAEAESSFQDGLKIAREIGDEERVSALLNDLGWVTLKQGKLAEADQYLQEGLNIARKLANDERICGIYNALGTVADYSGDVIKAETYLQEGLALARKIRDQEQSCGLLVNLGVVANERGNLAQSEEYFKEGLTLARQIGHRERISILLANLGDTLATQGNYAQAEIYLQEGLLVTKQIEHREWTSAVLSNLGLVAWKRGNYTQGEAYYQESLALARQIGNPIVISQQLDEYGTLLLDQHKIDAADAAFKEILTIIPSESQRLVALAQYGLARVAAAHGNLQEAQKLGKASVAGLGVTNSHQVKEVKDWLNSITDLKSN